MTTDPINHRQSAFITAQIKEALSDDDPSNDYDISIPEGASITTFADGVRNGYGFTERQISTESLKEKSLQAFNGEGLLSDNLTFNQNFFLSDDNVRFGPFVERIERNDYASTVDKAAYLAGGYKDADEMGGDIVDGAVQVAPYVVGGYAAEKAGKAGWKRWGGKILNWGSKAIGGRLKPIAKFGSAAYEKGGKLLSQAPKAIRWFGNKLKGLFTSGAAVGTATGIVMGGDPIENCEAQAEKVGDAAERIAEEISN